MRSPTAAAVPPELLLSTSLLLQGVELLAGTCVLRAVGGLGGPLVKLISQPGPALAHHLAPELLALLLKGSVAWAKLLTGGQLTQVGRIHLNLHHLLVVHLLPPMADAQSLVLLRTACTLRCFATPPHSTAAAAELVVLLQS
jgi:hypothetical protein